MSDFERGFDTVQSKELKELALFFFKKGDCTAEEAYEHAQSFLSISRNKYGKDILDVVVKYDHVIEHAPEYSNGVEKYFLYYGDAESGGKSAVVTLLGNFITPEKARDAVDDYIIRNMLPKKLIQDNSKVIKVRRVRDSDARQLCKGVFVEKHMIICD